MVPFSLPVGLELQKAVFIYLQPFFATLFAIGLGKDELSWVKIIAALLIFSGVYLVIQKKSEVK